MSLLSQANQAALEARKRQPVQVYAPGAPPPPPPAAPPVQGAPPVQTKWSEMAARMGPPPEEEEEGGSAWGRGLGYVVNNPLVQGALKPLEYADYLRRGVTLGVETAATHLPGVLEPIVPLAPFVDEERVAADERSWREKLGDAEYGFGQISADTGNKWLDRGIGLVGDLALDPLTYVAGIGVAGKAGGVAGKAANSAALTKALDAGVDANRLARVGRQGFGFADDEIMKAAGLRNGIRVGLMPSKSVTIPGSGKLIEPISKARGVAASRLRDTKVGGKVMEWRTPKGLEDAYDRIYRGTGPLDIDTALQRVALENAKRAAQGGFSRLAQAQAEQLINEIRKASDGDTRAILRDIESAAAGAAPKTELGKKYAKFLEEMRLAAKDAGVDIKKRQSYTPRILTRDAVKALRNDAESARNMKGLITVDLYDPSGVTMSRKIRKGSEFELGGNKITVTDDSIEGINKAVRDAGLNFNLYESDPGVVLEKYINMVSSDVGWAKAFAQRADKLPDGMLRDISKQVGLFREGKESLKEGARSIVDDLGADTPNTLIRGSGKVDPQADLETLGQRLGTDFDPDVFQAEKAIENRPVISTKGATKGRPKLTADGRSKVEAVDLTAEHNAKVAENLRQHQKVARATRLTLRQRLESKTRGARQDLKTALNDQIEASEQLFATLNEQKRIAIQIMKESGRFPRGQIDDAARHGLDEIFRELDDDIRFMNAALERSGTNRPLRLRVNKLKREIKEAKEALAKADQRSMRAMGNEAQNIAAKRAALTGDLPAKQQTYDEALAAARATHGADDAVAAHQKINAEMDALRRQAREGKDVAAKLKTLDAQYQKALAKARAAIRKVEADPAVKQAKRELEQGELRVARTPYAGTTPNAETLNNAKRLDIETQIGEVQRRISRLHEAKVDAVDPQTPNRRTYVDFDGQIAHAENELASLRAAHARLRPKVVPSAEEALRARETSLRARIPENAGEVVKRVDEVKSKTGEIEDIIQRPDAAKTQAKREMLAKQRPARVASMKARSGASQLEVIASSKEASMRMRKASQERLRKLNTETLKDNPSYTAREYPDEVQGRLHELKTVIELDEAGAIPHDVAVQTEHELNKALDLLEEVREADLHADKISEHLRRAKKDDLGRVVRAKLHEEWSLAGEEFGVGNIAMHEKLARSLEQVRSASYHKDFWPVVDTFTNLFKTYATLTPGFHVRNAMSAVFMNSSDGISIAHQAEGARLFRQFRKAKDPKAWLSSQPPEVQQAFEAAAGSGIGGRFFERGVGDRTSLRYRSMEKAFDNPVTRKLGHGLGGSVEGAVRLPIALQVIREGGTVDDALARITRLHFDYSQVSQFDEAAKRLIPFWTFMSRNLPLQVTQMWTKPRTYAKYRSFIRNARVEDEPNTPDYFNALGAFNTGENLGGLPLYLQPDFAHTRLDEDVENIEAFLSGENMLRPLSDFNPLFTAPAEFATGKNFFTGREYDETDVRQTGGLEAPIGALGRLFGQNVEGPGGEQFTSEKFIDMLRSVNPVYDRSARLAPGVTSGSKSKDQEARQLESWLRFIGAPVRQLSPQQQNAAAQSERYEGADARRMEAALRRLLADAP